MVWRTLHALHPAVAAVRPSLVYKATPDNEAIIDKCPALDGHFHPTWFLFNGHLQTVRVGRGGRAPSVSYKRQLVRMSNGGTVSIDWAIPPGCTDLGYEHDHPTIIMLHGLAGDSQNNYIRSAATKLLRDGWRVVVMNARGCGNTPVTSPQFLSASFTEDIREVVALLRKDYVPTAPLVGVGFSMGSNVLVKFVGEEGASCLLTEAASIGNVFDLNNNLKHMNTLFYYYLYNISISKTIIRLFFQKQFENEPGIDIDHVRAAKTAWQFDDRLTRHVLGYASVEEYYRDASSRHCTVIGSMAKVDLVVDIPRVRIPLLCLSALDDPVCTHTSIPYRECADNERVILATTARGGHLGYYTSDSFWAQPDMWSSTVAAQYCKAIVVEQVWRDRLQAFATTSAPSSTEDVNKERRFLFDLRIMLACFMLYVATIFAGFNEISLTIPV
ncbi:unnamed protein product [Aphanomyces euteiches]